MKKCGSMCGVAWIAWVLLIIGGLNWGLVGIGGLMNANWNVVDLLLNRWTVVEGIVYILVGISALVCLFGCRCKKCRSCDGDMSKPAAPMNNASGEAAKM